MCGLVALFAYGTNAKLVDSAKLIAMRDSMRHRGPDGEGLWLSEDRRVGFGHRRLAIIDTNERSAQPIVSANGRFHMVFNGEIYNYRALRSELEQQGVSFRTSGDSEVLLELFARKGLACLKQLRGMYAFAIWDAQKRELSLARDPLGIKPLYYWDDGQRFFAASEIGALLVSGEIERRPDPAGQVAFYMWGQVPAPYTFFAGIRSLEAGAALVIGPDGRQEMCSGPRVADLLDGAAPLPTDPARLLIEALEESLMDHLTADVSVGLFLSAGKDSSALACLLAQLKQTQVHCFTLSAPWAKGDDEAPIAGRLAGELGLRHDQATIAASQFEEGLPRIFRHMDQPSIDGVNVYFIAHEARQCGLRVALSGLGADEVLGGYPSFEQVPKLVSKLKPFAMVPGLGRAFRFMTADILKHFAPPKLASLFEFGGTYPGAYLLRRGLFMPWELTDVLDPEIVRTGLRELQTESRLAHLIQGVTHGWSKVAVLELSWYMRHQLLRDSDWAGMAHGLEIRVPFADWKFISALAPLLAQPKGLSKSMMLGALPRKLPDDIAERRKTGFVLPVEEWIGRREEIASLKPWQTRGLRGWARFVHKQFAHER